MATLTDLVRVRPELVHVTFGRGWDNVQTSGCLMSVTTLVKEAGINGPDTVDLVSSYRQSLTSVTLPDGTHAVLRDQLRRRKDVDSALKDLTEREWLRLLNARVFLFPSGHKRISELVEAYTKRGYEQEVISFETAELLNGYEPEVEVCTVNSGTFSRTKAPSRGRDTFVPLAKFPEKSLARVQEVTVFDRLHIDDKSVRGVMRYLPSGGSERMWRRSTK
jgi:hypothetical protein